MAVLASQVAVLRNILQPALHPDPRHPEGIWGGLATLTGDATGGAMQLAVQASRLFVSQHYMSLEGIHLRSTAALTGSMVIEAQFGGPAITPEGGDFTEVWGNDIVAGAGVRSHKGGEAPILGRILWNGQPVRPVAGTTISIVLLEIDNVNLAVVTIGAWGYFWHRQN